MGGARHHLGLPDAAGWQESCIACPPTAAFCWPAMHFAGLQCRQLTVHPPPPAGCARSSRPRSMLRPNARRPQADPLSSIIQQPPALAGTQPVRKTKLVCTIGPATCQRDDFFRLADAGMDVARLNMSHGTHESHKAVVDLVHEYNATGR